LNILNKAIVIAGPTGVGKTKISIDLASELNAEIISSDSAQVYRGLNIGTAKIREEEKEGIKHHLIDIVEPVSKYSVGNFEKDVNKILNQNSEKNAINPQQAQPKQQADTVQPVVQAQTNQTETVSEIQEKSINNPQRVQISKSEIISLKSNELSFHKNSTDLKKEAYSVLRDIKDYVEKNDYVVSIIGYTDKSGASSYNKRLSLRRAEKVGSKLIEFGLSKDRIVDLVGRGDSNPIKTNDTKEGREENRRVEFRFVKRGQV